MVTIKIPRKAFIVLALLLSAVAASAVIAAWVTNGSGPGYAKAQTASNLTLSDASASDDGYKRTGVRPMAGARGGSQTGRVC